MRWYLYRNDTVHGPYEKEELKAFLAGSDFVAKEGTDAWIEASKDLDLEDIFVTFIAPDLEWFVTPKGKPTRGPFAQPALLNLLKRKEVGPDDAIKHASWPKAVPLRETRIYRFMTDPTVKLEDVPPDEWKNAPKQKGENAPPPPALAAKPLADRFRIDFEMTTAKKIAIALVAILPVAGYGVYEYWYKGSDMAFRAQHGTPTGDCTKDEISKNICAEQPAKCGCQEKGSCTMSGCDMYAKLKHQGVIK